MELLSAYPDAEDVLLDLLEPVAPTVLATPVTLVPPLVEVRRVGGSDNKITDSAMFQVHTYGSSQQDARALAEACRQRIIAAPATTVAGVAIDMTFTELAPVFADYGQRDIFRYIATYVIEFRRTF